MSTTFEIETGFELPTTRHPGRPRKYPFPQLQPGESFFVPERTDGRSASATVRNAASINTRRLRRKFAVRTATKDGVKGFRVFRIK